MAKLSDLTRERLLCLPNGNGGWGVAHGQGNLACWNWALTGFGPIQNNPDAMFDYISYGNRNIPPDRTNNVTAAFAHWWNKKDNAARIQGLYDAWTPYRGPQTTPNPARDNLRHQICTMIVKFSCELNGLKWTDAQTPYKVRMHYDHEEREARWVPDPSGATDLNGNPRLVPQTDPTRLDHSGRPAVITHFVGFAPPNYTHWWLQVDNGGPRDDGIEAFPGSPDLFFRRPQYSTGLGPATHNCTVYIQELHRSHVEHIEDALEYLCRTQFGGTGFGHGAYDTTGWRCYICRRALHGKDLHHCHCCGKAVCAEHSGGRRRQLFHQNHSHNYVPVFNPNKRRFMTDPRGYRVCMWC
jgi:hypothetical protein